MQEGELRRKTKFGLTTTYRVTGLISPLGTIQCEIVDVKGLPTGMSVWLQVEAVEAMEVVDDA